MNKTDLVYTVAEKCDLSKKASRKVIDMIFTSISSSLANGEKVELAGLGRFEIRERAERIGRNPKTGEEINIEATKYPMFTPGKELKDAINAECNSKKQY